LAGLGVIGIAAIALMASASPLARWTLAETLAPQRVLPLLGLGAAFGMGGARTLGAAFLLLGVGLIVGFAAQDRLLQMLDVFPQAAIHLFMTGPISYLAAGAALASGKRLGTWLTPITALVVGAMLALVIKLTDPSLHEPAYTWTPVLIAFWIVGGVSMTLRAFWRSWFAIFGRILGSWLLAIGLLYGGASLVPKRQPPPAAPLPEFNQPIPGFPGKDQQQP